jgi:trans-aconitate methyltransferase
MSKSKYINDQAQKYSQFAPNDFSWNYMEKPELQRLLTGDNNSSKKVLDLGCGAGRSMAFLTTLGFLEKNIVGVDTSGDLLKLAKKDLPNASFIESDIVEFDLAKSSVDTVYSVMVLHYLALDDLVKVFFKCFSWLKPHGTFIFVTLHPLRYAERDYLKYFLRDEREESTPWGTKIKYFHKTISDYVGSLINVGFEISAVMEPVPQNDSKDVDPKLYDKYSLKPTRLIIMCHKRSGNRI